MNNTYIASTVYHLYLIAFHILEQEKLENKKTNHLLILLKNTPKIETLIDGLESSNFFRKVIYVDYIPDLKKELNFFDYLFNRKKIVSLFEKKNPVLKQEEDFIKKSEIHICDSDYGKNYFYFKYRKNKDFIMFEDGAGTYVNKVSKFTILKKRLFKNGFTRNGYGKEVSKIIAVNTKKLPKQLQKKSFELNINEIAKRLSIRNKEEIFKIFNFEFLKLSNKKNRVLIIGSTISEDNIVASEKDKIFIFKDVIKNIDESKTIYFKHHPRENTVYNFNREVIFLPKLFPLELLTLDESVVFEEGYSILSTALENLGDTIEKKYYVANKYIHLFTNYQQEAKNIIKNT